MIVKVNGILTELQPVDAFVTTILKSYVPAVIPDVGIVIEIGDPVSDALDIGVNPVRTLVPVVIEY